MKLGARLAAASLVLATVSACARPTLDDGPEMDQPKFSSDEAPISLGLVHMDGVAPPEEESPYCNIDGPDEVPVPDHRLYATWQTFPMTLAEDGFDGSVRVLQDSRFTGAGSRHGTNAMLPPCDGLPGRIELLDAHGVPVNAWPTGEQTDVTAHHFAPGQTVFQVVSLVQCLASCWCGNHVSFLHVEGDHLTWIASQRGSGKAKSVYGVTAGCYEGGGVQKGADTKPEIAIHRTVLLGGADVIAVYVNERHFFDGQAWRSTVQERRAPW
jgi:hypothetical protein